MLRKNKKFSSLELLLVDIRTYLSTLLLRTNWRTRYDYVAYALLFLFYEEGLPFEVWQKLLPPPLKDTKLVELYAEKFAVTTWLYFYFFLLLFCSPLAFIPNFYLTAIVPAFFIFLFSFKLYKVEGLIEKFEQLEKEEKKEENPNVRKRGKRTSHLYH